MRTATSARKRSTHSRTHKLRNSATQKLVITIDGPAGAGKSTVAKLLAKELGLTYLDTGATYRALAFAWTKEPNVEITDVLRLAAMARWLPIRFESGHSGAPRVFLNGVEITRTIRTQEVSEAAAQISQYPEVRSAMVARQRELAKDKGLVVEGRDTGSVVFPGADYKFFLDADLSVRARRRQQELRKLYGEPTPLAQIREELHFRDSLDIHRHVGPLVKPKGAVAIDTTNLTARQVMQRMRRHIRDRR